MSEEVSLEQLQQEVVDLRVRLRRAEDRVRRKEDELWREFQKARTAALAVAEAKWPSLLGEQK